LKQAFDIPEAQTFSTFMQAEIFEITDAPSTTATPDITEVGDTVYGTIDTPYNHDWIAIDLEAGEDGARHQRP